MKTAVKICGLMRSEDVKLACELGAAYVGFNFAAGSPRRLDLDRAGELADAVSPGVLRVGVFRGEDLATIRSAVERCRLELVQLHRRLTVEDIARLPVPVLGVARMEGGALRAPAPDLLSRCHALLVDPSEGTGTELDVALVDSSGWSVPIFLAGGLTPENVGATVRRLRPAGVDVATGVESAPGVKDPARLERFIAAVEEADRAPR